MARRVSKKPPAKRAAKSAAGATHKAAPRRKAARLAVHVASPPAAASAPVGASTSRQPAWRAGLLAEMSRGLQRAVGALEPAEPAPASRSAGKAAHKELRASLRSALEHLTQQIESTKGG